MSPLEKRISMRSSVSVSTLWMSSRFEWRVFLASICSKITNLKADCGKMNAVEGEWIHWLLNGISESKSNDRLSERLFQIRMRIQHLADWVNMRLSMTIQLPCVTLTEWLALSHWLYSTSMITMIMMSLSMSMTDIHIDWVIDKWINSDFSKH